MRGPPLSPPLSFPRWAAFWWAIAPGGSVDATTQQGRAVACFMWMVGIFGLSFPVSVIAIEFERAYRLDLAPLQVRFQPARDDDLCRAR